MSWVAVETKSDYLMRWIIKRKLKHGYQIDLTSTFSTKSVGCGGRPEWPSSPTPPEPPGGGLALCWEPKGCWAEVTLPATHTMSIVSGLISSASFGFLALYLLFLRLPYRAVERINLRSSLPFQRGTNERRIESSRSVICGCWELDSVV